MLCCIKSGQQHLAAGRENFIFFLCPLDGEQFIHVTCLFDEFANQKIPNWEHLVSVIRSRNISAHIVLQTFSQLKGMYKDNAETVAGCCSTMLFLGGKEESSLKMVSGLLGKETIDTMNESDSRGAQRTYGLNSVSYTHLPMSSGRIGMAGSSTNT